jgi:hypothetical protein
MSMTKKGPAGRGKVRQVRGILEMQHTECRVREDFDEQVDVEAVPDGGAVDVFIFL